MKSTKLITENGTEVILEHRCLDDDFCEKAKSYYCKKHKISRNIFNTYFIARAIELYIIDTNTQPVYE